MSKQHSENDYKYIGQNNVSSSLLCSKYRNQLKQTNSYKITTQTR